MEMAAASQHPQHEVTERRIAQLTWVVGAATAAGAVFLYPWRVGAGVLIGAAMAWLNFRWLERAMDAVTRASTAQADSPQAHVPVGSYLALFARYLLLAAAVYVIFSRLRISVLSMLVGMCALGAAAMLATVWEVLTDNRRAE